MFFDGTKVDQNMTESRDLVKDPARFAEALRATFTPRYLTGRE